MLNTDQPFWKKSEEENLTFDPLAHALFYPLIKTLEPNNIDVPKPTSGHLRAAQEVVELDLADGRVRLEVGELVSEQKSRHGRFFATAFPERDHRRAQCVLRLAGPREGTRKCAVIGC